MLTILTMLKKKNVYVMLAMVTILTMLTILTNFKTEMQIFWPKKITCCNVDDIDDAKGNKYAIHAYTHGPVTGSGLSQTQ